MLLSLFEACGQVKTAQIVGADAVAEVEKDVPKQLVSSEADEGASTHASSRNSLPTLDFDIDDDQEADGRSPDETLIIVDWDDTLLPTSWLDSKRSFNKWWNELIPAKEVLTSAEGEELEALDLAAAAFLEAAAKLGQVVCVTLAKPLWVKRTMEAFMPCTTAAWRRNGVLAYFASSEQVQGDLIGGKWVGEVPMPLEQAQLRFQLNVRRKEKAMRKALRHFYGRGQSWRHVMSVGDGEFEQQALQHIGFTHKNRDGEPLLCKTVKLPEQPSCSQMTSNMQELLSILPEMARVAEDVDWFVSEKLQF